MKLLKRHFDRAVKQPWSTQSCILAQCAKDNNLSAENGEGIKEISGEYVSPFNSSVAQQVRGKFDALFNFPGDECSVELQALRASLPIEL